MNQSKKSERHELYLPNHGEGRINPMHARLTSAEDRRGYTVVSSPERDR